LIAAKQKTPMAPFILEPEFSVGLYRGLIVNE